MSKVVLDFITNFEGDSDQVELRNIWMEHQKLIEEIKTWDNEKSISMTKPYYSQWREEVSSFYSTYIPEKRDLGS